MPAWRTLWTTTFRGLTLVLSTVLSVLVHLLTRPFTSFRCRHSKPITRFPVALLPLILGYVGTDDGGDGGEDGRQRCSAILRDLKSCSLVCVDWANHCRPLIVPKLSIMVLSPHARILLAFYATWAGERVIPMEILIVRWIRAQEFDEAQQKECLKHSRSWFWSGIRVEHIDGLALTLIHPVRRLQTEPSGHLTLGDFIFPSHASITTFLRHFESPIDRTDDRIQGQHNYDSHAGFPIVRTRAGARAAVAWGPTDDLRICSRCSKMIHKTNVVYATIEDIPAELYPLIADYVGTADNGSDKSPYEGSQEMRNLCRYSLVCVDWANRWRPVIFREMRRVKSIETMKSLNLYAEHGSPRLISLADAITWWFLVQTWASRSWCHARYNSLFRIKNPEYRYSDGLQLYLSGPVPSHLPVSALHSPHWSLPRSMPACYTPFTGLTLSNIHFPSLSSIAKLLRHFTSLEDLSFRKITWAEDGTYFAPPIAHTTPTTFRIRAEACTNNIRLCTMAHDVPGRSSSFKRLRAKEQQACLALSHPASSPVSSGDQGLKLHKTRTSRSISREFKLSSFRDTLHLTYKLTETFWNPTELLELWALVAHAVPPQPSSITALHFHVLSRRSVTFSDRPVVFLKSFAEEMLSLRLLTVCFDDDVDMKYVTQADPSLRTPLVIVDGAEITYRFLCRHLHTKEFAQILPLYGQYDTFVEVDPATLLPTGQIWEDHREEEVILKAMMKKYHPHLLLDTA